MPRTGRHRTGSVYFVGSRNQWVGAISLGGGKRRTVTGRTENEVRERLAAVGVVPPARQARRPYRELATTVARAVLERAIALGWDADMTARVMAASMTKHRIYRSIVGPCVYCGDELADTVDHATPFAVGGTDEPENVVSSCWSCNARKGRKTSAEWGSDARSAARVADAGD